MGLEIQFNAIQKEYQGRFLYHELSGTVPAGQCTCITGNNGSGKSTFLQIIAGLIRPTSGTILYKDGAAPLDISEVREKIAFVSPEMQLYDCLTAAENLEFFAGMAAVSLTPQRIGEILQMVELRAEPKLPISRYSTGMRQRLKLALLLAADKKTWFLDEPSANLDENGRRTVKLLIEQAAAQQRTVLLATNEPGEVTYGDTIFRLS